LTDLVVGDQAVIESIGPESTEVLTALASRGLLPGVEISVQEIEVFDGPRRLRTQAGDITIGRRLAEHLHVKAAV
jgi:Fe2+ transport system protein FeoA